MHRLTCGAIFAAVFLAGCGPTADPAQATYAEGLAAYRKGDRDAFTAAMDSLKQASEVTAEYCTLDGLTADRSRYMLSLLRPLDQPMLFSMSEEARFVYQGELFMSGGPHESARQPTEECKGKTALLLTDGLQRNETIKAWMNSSRAWREELAVRHGPELESRITSAEHLLEVYHLDRSA